LRNGFETADDLAEISATAIIGGPFGKAANSGESEFSCRPAGQFAVTASGRAPSAAPLEFRSVTKKYSGTEKAAIDELSFTVPAGEVCVLVGPSGCGKTTAMRLVNRMIDLTSGDILIDEKTIAGRNDADLRREIGYVIQQVGLFPHLTINHNITMVPRLLGWDRRRLADRAAELLELIGLPEEMGRRYPSQLSGGQRQRVGVARALAADPLLMLMDEPFGAIDPINRERLQNEFQRLQRELRKTTVFVTHDIDEAIKMGDRIAILREGGQLVQYDTPARILAHPADDFVAQFVGADRGLKRLALTRLQDIQLEPVNGPSDSGDGTSIPINATLRDALSTMMSDSMRPLLVVDDGRPAGYVSIELINRVLRDGADTKPSDAVAGERVGPS
jgi:osmoprotectant transport system ATP-binding protein